MKTFIEFVTERKTDPEKLAVRAAGIYGKKTNYGPDYDKPAKGKHIPLSSYNSRKANAMWDKFESDNHESSSKTVPIKSLHAAQPYARIDDPEKLKEKLKDTKPANIVVAKHKGLNYVVDGHHSVLAAHLRGEKNVEAKYYDLDGSR